MLALQFQAFKRFSPIARIRPSVSSRPTLVPNPPRHVCDKPLDRQQASQIRFALITRIAAYCALDIRQNPATGSARSPFAKAMLRKENRMKLLTSFLAVTALSLAASVFAQEDRTKRRPLPPSKLRRRRRNPLRPLKKRLPLRQLRKRGSSSHQRLGHRALRRRQPNRRKLRPKRGRSRERK